MSPTKKQPKTAAKKTASKPKKAAGKKAAASKSAGATKAKGAAESKASKKLAATKLAKPSKAKQARDVLDFSEFPAGSVSRSDVTLCLACIFRLFTNQPRPPPPVASD